MTERKGAVTFQGNPLTLLGKEPKAGEMAPNATLIDNELKPVTIHSFKGKNLIISCVPSLDTPVCDTETRKFNQKASSLNNNTVILTISMDLPFAQKRWCGAAGIDKVVTLSDYKSAEFGNAYGVLIKELHLLARSIFVIDREGMIRYIQNVGEITKEPNYDEVINAAKELK